MQEMIMAKTYCAYCNRLSENQPKETGVTITTSDLQMTVEIACPRSQSMNNNNKKLTKFEPSLASQPVHLTLKPLTHF